MNKDSFCRLCAENRNDKSLISINDPVAVNLNLCRKIYKYFHIKIEENDILSKNICPQCCGQVVLTHNFNETVQKAQETLKAAVLERGNYNILSELDAPDSIKFDAFQDPSQDDEFGTSNQKNEETQTVEEYKEKPSIKRINNKKKYIKSVEFTKRLRKRIRPVKTPLSELSNEQLSKTDLYNDAKSVEEDEVCITSSKDGWDKYPWKCAACSLLFSSVLELRQHFSSVHNETPSYTCIDCKKTAYSGYHGFLLHVQTHRPHLKYCCDFCSKYFRNKQTLEQHRLNHSELKVHSCQKCGKSFSTKSGLYIHMRSHLSSKEKSIYTCDICFKTFATKPNLMAHERIHAGIKNYTCELCGKSFVQKGNLAHHMLTHSVAEPFKCSQCTKAFKTVDRLKRHETVHSGIKPYQCDICNKGFREKGTLNDHRRIHTGARPFTCEDCGKSFRFKGILTTHRRQHTGERPYSCLECQHHFTNWPNYNKHMKRRHGINTSVTVRKPQTIPPTGKPCRNPPGTVIVSTTPQSTGTISTTTTSTKSNLKLTSSDALLSQINVPVSVSTPNQLFVTPTLSTETAYLSPFGLTMPTTASVILTATPPLNDNKTILNTPVVDSTTNISYYLPNLLNLYNIPQSFMKW